MKKWLLGLTMALNQLSNAILGGDPQMTISARAGYARERDARTGRIVCAVLNVLDAHADGHTPEGDHCVKAIRNYEERDRAIDNRKMEVSRMPEMDE